MGEEDEDEEEEEKEKERKKKKKDKRYHKSINPLPCYPQDGRSRADCFTEVIITQAFRDSGQCPSLKNHL